MRLREVSHPQGTARLRLKATKAIEIEIYSLQDRTTFPRPGSGRHEQTQIVRTLNVSLKGHGGRIAVATGAALPQIKTERGTAAQHKTDCCYAALWVFLLSQSLTCSPVVSGNHPD